VSYIIGSFNLRDFNFSNRSSDGTQEQLERNFRKIAEIIVKEKFDVVALQEINAELPLKYLTNLLNANKGMGQEFECKFGTDMPNQGGSHDPERYGFIWNAKRLRLLKTRRKNRRDNNPGYYESAGAIGLIRPPYYARFTARGMLGGSNFELRLVNTHIIDASCEKDRIHEFEVLVKQVLPRICDHQELSEDGEVMPAYTFLLGDYNLRLNKRENSIYKIDTITETKYTGKKRYYKTVQEAPTTLRMPRDQVRIEDCYANDYDHFTYEADMDTKLVLTPQRVEALSKYFADTSEVVDKLKNYRVQVSDHVPIKMTVDFK
jgi:endonuclease/exonuclease/phosphatase family metal-dependent hydrolase